MVAAATAVALAGLTLEAGALVAADWDSVNGGTIGELEFEVAGLAAQGENLAVIPGQDLVGPDYEPFAQSGVDTVAYGFNNLWTMVLNQPVDQLYVYVDGWRGSILTAGDDPAFTYTFDRTPQIVAGLDGAQVSGNTLILDDDFDSFYDGVLLFEGATLLSLTVESTNATSQAVQRMTFALVPEPASLAVFGIGGLLLAGRRRRAC